jgi:hypothetical protein
MFCYAAQALLRISSLPEFSPAWPEMKRSLECLGDCPLCLRFAIDCLTYWPDQRPSTERALRHELFNRANVDSICFDFHQNNVRDCYVEQETSSCCALFVERLEDAFWRRQFLSGPLRSTQSLLHRCRKGCEVQIREDLLRSLLLDAAEDCQVTLQSLRICWSSWACMVGACRIRVN